MSTKALKEIKKLSPQELTKLVTETQNEIFMTKMKLKTGQVANTSAVWKLRKSIARAKTLQGQAQAGKK